MLLIYVLLSYSFRVQDSGLGHGLDLMEAKITGALHLHSSLLHELLHYPAAFVASSMIIFCPIVFPYRVGGFEANC